MSTETRDVEGRDWRQYAIWNKNGHMFICHAVDGNDCIGPIPHRGTAKAVLTALRTLREQVERLRGERDGWFEALRAESERVLAARSRVAALQEEVEGHATALLNATARAAKLEAALTNARQTVAFFASVIKSGEPWTDDTDEAFRRALDTKGGE